MLIYPFCVSTHNLRAQFEAALFPAVGKRLGLGVLSAQGLVDHVVDHLANLRILFAAFE